ncbi:MAG: Rieske 2Fe-2S domain-containing protein [Gammaproteobacteria bacterium]|nr:Rieske 2Fe-2S domain-containing protein [Gammaproteobacteria bacterium]
MTLSRRRAIAAGWLAIIGFTQRTVRSATEAEQTGFLDLNDTVAFPMDTLNDRWDLVKFDAELSTGKGDKRLQGVLLKTGVDVAGCGDLRALCTICPHEVCAVEFVEDSNGFRNVSDVVTGQPLFVCPCHFSVFDPMADGAVIGGPAHRGLYAFAFELSDNEIRITGIEAGVLDLLS